MSDPFRRSAPKLGRNDPCFCGSRKKFKRCHGRVENTLPALLARDRIEKEIIAQGKRHLEREKAKELQRQKQQGRGRPIISTEVKGTRFVAIGGKVAYGKWKTFPDFLHHYIKVTIGEAWGNAEIAKPLEERHPLMQWYDKMCHLQQAHFVKPGELFSTPVTGAVSAYNRLAYNLYLIAHNGKDIQTRLLTRLRNNENFQGAYYETQVAAWLIKAGFELEFEDEQDTSSSHCEFTATYIPTGEKFSVEAKGREFRPGGATRLPVGNQLGKALAKQAAHRRLVFIDLNKALHGQQDAFRTADRAERLIMALQPTMQIDGNPAPSAYVAITNMNDQHALDQTSIATMVNFMGFKLPDFLGEYSSPREAARARERHLPIFKLMKSIEEHSELPQTFGGELPSEVFSTTPIPRLKIGTHYVIPAADGSEKVGELVQAIVSGDKAHTVMRDPRTGEYFLATAEMTKEELDDYAKHPDTYFGTYQRVAKKIETVMDMYDFFAEAHRDTPKDKLIALIPNYADQAALEHFSQKELVEIVAERYTAGAMERGFQPKSLEQVKAARHGGRKPDNRINSSDAPSSS